MVSVDYIDNKNKLYRFKINNVDFPTLNALRRLLNYCVPIYAIDEIEYFENQSPTNDEFLGNRIGLCPIKTPLDTTGKTVKFGLEIKGACRVYTKDFKTSDSEIDFVYDNIPLTKLAENKSIKLEGNAILGQGRDHVKFSAAIVSYSQLVKLKTLKKCDSCSACIEACPKDNLEIKKKKVKIKDPLLCDACRACVDACPKNALEMKYKDDFVFNIELIGQIGILDLIKKTRRYTKKYFKLLKKNLK